MKHHGKAWGLSKGSNIGAKAFENLIFGDPHGTMGPIWKTGYYCDKMTVTLPKTAFRRGAVSFDEWSTEITSKYWRQLWSIFIELCERIIETHSKYAKEEETHYEDWKEEMRKKPDTEQGHVYQAERKLGPDAVKCFIESIYASNDVTADVTIEEGDAVPVVSAYRLHCFILYDVDIGKIFWDLLEENKTLHKQCEDKTLRNKQDCDLSTVIQPHQHYKYISSAEHWVKCIVGMYKNTDEYWRQTIVLTEEDEDEPIPLEVRKRHPRYFPAHPSNIFTLASAIYRTKCIDKCTSNTLQCDDKEYIKRTFDPHGNLMSEHFTFPIAESVIKLTTDQVKNASLFAKYMPDYQRYRLMRALKELKKMSCDVGYFLSSALEEKAYGTERYTSMYEAESRCGANHTAGHLSQMEQVREQANVFSDSVLLEYGGGLIQQDKELAALMTSDFRILRDAARREPIQSRDLNDQDDRDQYIKFQHRMLNEFESRCWSKDAAISDPAKAIVCFYNEDQHIIPSTAHVYSNLSIFGDMIAKRMAQYEHITCVSIAHRPLLLLNVARYDAYRDDTGLHFNMVFTGEGATSKSFLLEEMARCCIKGTAQILSYETSKASAVDGPQNDQINIFNEAPPGTLTATKASGSADKQACALFKEKLTSNIVRVKTFFQKEGSHIRENRIATSECVGAWFGATNDAITNVEDALRTRFHWAGFEEKDRLNRDVTQCQTAFKALLSTTAGRGQVKSLILFYRQEQMLIFLIEKLISCGIMKDVNMREADVIFARFNEQMKLRGHPCAPRDQKRLRIIARIFTLVYAVECTFRIQGSKLYGKETFELKDILQVEPFLFCVPEIAMFCVELMSEQYIDPAKDKVLTALRSILKMQFYEQGAYVKRMYDKVSREDNLVEDYNYIRFPWKLNTLRERIHAAIPREDGKPSKNNIGRVLSELKSFQVAHVRYVGMDDQGCPSHMGGEMIRSVACVVEQRYIKIHSGILIGDEQRKECELIKDVLNALATKCTRPNHYITGRLLKKNAMLYYHRFDVQKRVPNEKRLRIINPLFCTRSDKASLGLNAAECNQAGRDTEFVEETEFLDTAARETHHSRLGIEWDSALSSTCCPEECKRRRLILEDSFTRVVYPPVHIISQAKTISRRDIIKQRKRRASMLKKTSKCRKLLNPIN